MKKCVTIGNRQMGAGIPIVQESSSVPPRLATETLRQFIDDLRQRRGDQQSDVNQPPQREGEIADFCTDPASMLWWRIQHH